VVRGGVCCFVGGSGRRRVGGGRRTYIYTYIIHCWNFRSHFGSSHFSSRGVLAQAIWSQSILASLHCSFVHHSQRSNAFGHGVRCHPEGFGDHKLCHEVRCGEYVNFACYGSGRRRRMLLGQRLRSLRWDREVSWESRLRGFPVVAAMAVPSRAIDASNATHRLTP